LDDNTELVAKKMKAILIGKVSLIVLALCMIPLQVNANPPDDVKNHNVWLGAFVSDTCPTDREVILTLNLYDSNGNLLGSTSGPCVQDGLGASYNRPYSGDYTAELLVSNSPNVVISPSSTITFQAPPTRTVYFTVVSFGV
jgi:hypothetical protein